MSKLTDYQAAVTTLVKSVSGFGVTEQNKAILSAMSEHSCYKPLSVIEDTAGDGTDSYTLADELESWTDDFSMIAEIRYPEDADAALSEGDDFRIDETPDGKELLFLTAAPLSTELFRVRYTARHFCNSESCSVPASDEQAVQLLSAAYYCDIASSYYAQSGDSLISADSVNHQSKSQAYASRAASYRKLYYQHIGIGTEKQKPVSVTQDWDVYSPLGDRLVRKNRWR